MILQRDFQYLKVIKRKGLCCFGKGNGSEYQILVLSSVSIYYAALGQPLRILRASASSFIN
jgi:hypothetical protein